MFLLLLRRVGELWSVLPGGGGGPSLIQLTLCIRSPWDAIMGVCSRLSIPWKMPRVSCTAEPSLSLGCALTAMSACHYQTMQRKLCLEGKGAAEASLPSPSSC